MNKSRKVDLLYAKAQGKNYSATAEEERELRKYRVDSGDMGRKVDISSYVTAVDSGRCHISYYDYLRNNLLGDKRLKVNKNSAMRAQNSEFSFASIFVGWLTWGIAIYWMMRGQLSVGGSAIIGIIISFIVSKVARKWAAVLNFILPIVLAVVFSR